MKRIDWRLGLLALAPLAIASACTSSNDTGGGSNPDGGTGGGTDGSLPVYDAAGSTDGPGADTADATPPPAPSSSGAIGVVTIDGKQKLYLPTYKVNGAGHNVVSVLDVGIDGNGVAGAPALITDIDMGLSGDHSILSAGDSTMILVGSATTRNLWIIDPHTDTLVTTVQLDPSTKKTSFSTPDGYMNGIAVDSVHRKAYVSVWNGFAVFDMDSKTFTSTILVNPTENFAFDSVHQKIYAPFYSCLDNGEPPDATPPTCGDAKTADGGAIMTAGLSVIDLTDGTVYNYVDPDAADPTAPFGYDPDSAGVDPATQLVIVPDEFGSQYVLDFARAAFDKASKTVTAPHQIFTDDQYDGVAMEPTMHFGFLEHEFDKTVGLFQGANFTVGANLLPDGGGDAAVSGYIAAVMPQTPGNEASAAPPEDWGNVGDPHGVAVATGIRDGKPVAFLVDSLYNWVARVDLQKMSTLTGAVPGALTGPELAPAVTYLDALTLK